MAEWALPLIGIGAGAGQGFFAPEGQEVRSFAGQERNLPGNPNFSIDPGTHLAIGLQALNRTLDSSAARANAPVTMANTLPSSFVQQPASFSGGGLPMDIGVTGFDLANPLFTPTAPPDGFGFDLNALINQIRNGAVGGPGGPSGPPGGGGFIGTGIDDSQEFEPPQEQNRQFNPPPTFNNPPQGPVTAPPIPHPPFDQPIDTTLPPVEPPIGPPPGGGGGDPGERDVRPPSEMPEEPPPFFPPWERPPKTEVGGDVEFGGIANPTMQDALSMLGFPMNSIIRRT